jgi:hypothetical protein
MVRRRYLAAAVFFVALFAFALLPDLVGAPRGGHTEYLHDWMLGVASPALLPGHAENLPFWNSWTGPYLDNQSLRGLVNRFAQGAVLGLSPTLILLAIDAAFALLPAAFLSPPDNKRAAIDGAVLLIAPLALAPMTSRYHFVFVLPAVALIAAAIPMTRGFALAAAWCWRQASSCSPTARTTSSADASPSSPTFMALWFGGPPPCSSRWR